MDSRNLDKVFLSAFGNTLFKFGERWIHAEKI